MASFFPSREAVEDGIRDAVSQERVEHVELCERENNTSERPVALDERCLGEEHD